MARSQQSRIRPAAIDGRGLQPVDADGRLICLLCGNAYGHLGGHVAKTHGVTPRRYKEQFELPASRGLIGAETRAKLVAQAKHLLATDPRVQEGLRITDPQVLRQRLRKAAAANRRNKLRAGWTANRRRGPDPLARARHEQTARQHGYCSLVDMLERTWHLQRREVAALLGLANLYELYGRYDDVPRRPPSTPSVRPKPTTPPIGRRDSARRHYDQIAVELGYSDIVELLAAQQQLTNRQLAALLGIAVPTASHVRKRYAPHLVREHQAQADRGRGDRLAQEWREHYDQFARDVGYQGIDELVDQTRHLNHRQLAELFGLSANATAAIRRRYGTTAAPAKANNGRRHDYDQIARSLGHRSLKALLKATADLSNSKLADYLGIAYGTAWRLRHQPPS